MYKFQALTIRLSLFALVYFAVGITCSFAATFVVNTPLDTQDAVLNGICADTAGACSLRAAITEANALAGADIITLPANTYTTTIAGTNEESNADGDYDITSDITINGAGSGTTFVQANAVSRVATERVFHIIGPTAATALTVNINNLTVRNGGNNIGAGVPASTGAGIRLGQGTGGVITLSNLVMSGNTAASRGGGLAVDGPTGSTVNVTNCTISGNTAGSALAGTAARGAGITVGSATGVGINITNTAITGNTAASGLDAVGALGGGFYQGGTATTTFTNSSVSNNTASTTFAGSTAATIGGGIGVLLGTVTLQGNSVVSGNTANATNGTAGGLAGGIYNQQSILNVIDSSVTGNTASDFHGGIRTLAGTGGAATTTITRSTISNNTAQGIRGAGFEGQGGGVVNIASSTFVGTTNITSSTISGNRVLVSGAPGNNTLAGGVENFSTSSGAAVVNLTNSTVSGNSAAFAGGIYNDGGVASANLNYCTVASNTATVNGGGLLQDTTLGGAIRLKNSIVADNTAGTGPDIFGTITSQDYNHVENTIGGTFRPTSGGKGKAIEPVFFVMPNDVTGVDPQLGLLANNGGATMTHLPAVASPVVNIIPNGTSDCGTTVVISQNAVIRPAQTGCEKGAAERGTPLAAGVSISGRVKTAEGRGISNARVLLTDQNGQTHTTITSARGYYRFDDVEAGQTVILNVLSRRFQFSPRVISVTDELTDIDFTTNP